MAIASAYCTALLKNKAAPYAHKPKGEGRMSRRRSRRGARNNCHWMTLSTLENPNHNRETR